jgi:carboxypeptidase PM20D1
VTGHEKSAGIYLATQCALKGLHVEILSDKEGQYNFTASIYPLSLLMPNIIFLNHLDVVSAENPEDWIYPPFSGKIHEGMVWGRGAIDMKSMAIMQLLAIEQFMSGQNDSLRFNVTLLFVSGEEEVSDKGTKWVVENYFDYLNPLVVFGEGGSGVIGLFEKKSDTPFLFVSIAEKKVLWLELVIDEPSSGHGAVPPISYANLTTIKELHRLTKIKPRIYFSDCTKNTLHILGKTEKGAKGFVMKNVSLFRPIVVGSLRKNPMIHSVISNTMTLTHISNIKGSFNEISQKTIVHLDCRLLPGYSSSKFINKIENRLRSDKYRIEVIKESEEGGFSSLDHHFVQLKKALESVYQNAVVAPVLFPAITDNRYFRSRSIPAYGVSPVCLDVELLKSVHNINERIPIECLEKGLAVYVKLLENYNGGTILLDPESVTFVSPDSKSINKAPKFVKFNTLLHF